MPWSSGRRAGASSVRAACLSRAPRLAAERAAQARAVSSRVSLGRTAQLGPAPYGTGASELRRGGPPPPHALGRPGSDYGISKRCFIMTGFVPLKAGTLARRNSISMQSAASLFSKPAVTIDADTTLPDGSYCTCTMPAPLGPPMGRQFLACVAAFSRAVVAASRLKVLPGSCGLASVARAGVSTARAGALVARR